MKEFYYFLKPAIEFTLLMAFTLMSTQAAASARTTDEFTPPSTMESREDFIFSTRGFIGTLENPEIFNRSGKLALNLHEMNFIDEPGTEKMVNPSLLRHARLLNQTGLFSVTDNIYQVRGIDLANFTFIHGDTGWIVIDTGSSPAAAKSAYELVSHHLGSFPIKAIIYTHSHADHFGGTTGLVSQADVDAGKVEVIAPQGFMEHTIQEWLITGNAMLRRAQYQGGVALPRSPTGFVTFGLGNRIPRGGWSLIAPTSIIDQKVTARTIDGVELIFQLTLGTEAPAEMNIFIPEHGVLDMAENASPMMHQIYTLRGAEIRDAAYWAEQIGESIELFGEKTKVIISSHGWPRFGHEAAISFLKKHRDLYKYLHDQTVRMLNNGMNAEEIASHIKLPESLANEWYNRGYYGSVIHNVRGIYQRYMGWYDGNPAHLAALDPVIEASRYVEAMGGRDQVMKLAASAAAKDLAWSAILYNKLIMSDANYQQARNELASVYEELAYTQENALWRNEYLSAALELRKGIPTLETGSLTDPAILSKLPSAYLFDLLSVRLDPNKVRGAKAIIDLVFTDRNEQVQVRIDNDVMWYELQLKETAAEATISGTRNEILELILTHKLDPNVTITGDKNKAQAFTNWFETPDPQFPIIWRSNRD